MLALTFFFGFSTFSVLTSLSGIVTVSEAGGVSKSEICSSDVGDIGVLSETGGVVFFSSDRTLLAIVGVSYGIGFSTSPFLIASIFFS